MYRYFSSIRDEVHAKRGLNGAAPQEYLKLPPQFLKKVLREKNKNLGLKRQTLLDYAAQLGKNPPN